MLSFAGDLTPKQLEVLSTMPLSEEVGEMKELMEMVEALPEDQSQVQFGLGFENYYK